MSARLESEPTTELAVSIQGVCKKYKHFAIEGIDLQIPPASVLGLIGPNGAGKSTIMRIMMGLVRPDAGQVAIFGKSHTQDTAALKMQIGFFADDVRMYKPETIGWHLQFVRSLFPGWDEDYARELLQRFGLIEHQIVKGLSHGQRVKAMLLLLLARRPKLLILDEPTNGLDPVAKHEVHQELMRIVEAGDRTLIYSSHQTHDVEQICDVITFIDRGRVIASSNRDTFVDSWRRIKVRVPDAWQAPKDLNFHLETTLRNFRVFTVDRFDEQSVHLLQATGAEVEAVERLSLEEIFVSIVMRDRALAGNTSPTLNA